MRVTGMMLKWTSEEVLDTFLEDDILAAGQWEVDYMEWDGDEMIISFRDYSNLPDADDEESTG